MEPMNPVDENGKLLDSYQIVEGAASCYIGQVNNQRQPHGHGFMLFHSPHNQHQGNFENGRAHGPGIFVSANGDEYQGQWLENKRVGIFIVTKASGNKFKEKYDDETGKLQSRKKIDEEIDPPGPPALECWTCHGKFRETFNNAYSCRRHRSDFRFKPGADPADPAAPGVWSCCIKSTHNAPGCEFLRHNLNH